MAKNPTYTPEVTIATLPSGCPGWVTAELLDLTIKTWQKYSPKVITSDDALEILLNTSALLRVLKLTK